MWRDPGVTPHLTTTRGRTGPRGANVHAVVPAQAHDVQLHGLVHAQVFAASFLNSCVAVPQVQVAQLQDAHVQAEVVWVFITLLESWMVIRRSGVSGCRTCRMRVQRSSCGAQ